ncbi:MAG: flavodoxin domain-containing protein [Methanospirillum sp.]
MATILVAYASKDGATVEIASWTGEALRRIGATVDVRPADDVLTLEGLDAVVVGGPVYTGRVLRAVPVFFMRHRAVLAGKPVAVFIREARSAGTTPRQSGIGRRSPRLPPMAFPSPRSVFSADVSPPGKSL